MQHQQRLQIFLTNNNANSYTMTQALVLFSGGQDSYTSLIWAIDQFDKDNIRCISFDYGQRHAQSELEASKIITGLLDIPHETIEISSLQQVAESNLLNTSENISDKHKLNEDLPSSFVPGRNILFLTLAGAYAHKHGIHDLVTGVCETDYSGYPDCRRTTIDLIEDTLANGMEWSIEIHTPLMQLSKAQTVELLYDLSEKHGYSFMEYHLTVKRMILGEYNYFDLLMYTHTCYEGERPPCGECPACKLRAKGFETANKWYEDINLSDPLIEGSQ